MQPLKTTSQSFNTYNITCLTIDRKRIAAANSTFAIGGVSCSADSLVVAETFVLHINICAKNPAHRKSAKRQAVKKISFS